MVGAIRPLRFLHRQKSLLSSFVRRHRKALLIVGLVVASFFTVNVASAMAFDQEATVDGARIKTDKAVYMFGETVDITVYIVNKLNRSIGECASNIFLVISGPMGDAYRTATFNLCGGRNFLKPGSEAYLMGDSWKAWVVPGTYTVEVVIDAVFPAVGEPDVEESFTGSTTLMVIV